MWEKVSELEVRKCRIVHRGHQDKSDAQNSLHLFCRLTLTKVAVSGQRHKIGVEEMLVPDFIRSIVIDAHLKQSVVLLFYSYNACRGDKRTKQQMDEKKLLKI